HDAVTRQAGGEDQALDFARRTYGRNEIRGQVDSACPGTRHRYATLVRNQLAELLDIVGDNRGVGPRLRHPEPPGAERHRTQGIREQRPSDADADVAPVLQVALAEI